jgi:hypothetical protein
MVMDDNIDKWCSWFVEPSETTVLGVTVQDLSMDKFSVFGKHGNAYC